MVDEQSVAIKEIDAEAALQGLTARAAEIDEIIKGLEDSKIVTWETMQIEFTV